MLFSMLKFWFSRLSRGWKSKKWPKMSKISVCHILHFRNHILYDLHLWYTCMYKRIISPSSFFVLFKILIFVIIRGRGKRAKMVQNDRNFCLSHSVSQEPHIIWLWFLVHLCKMMIPLANFFIFQNFDLGLLVRVKGKKWTKITNFSLFCSISQEL